MEKSLSIRMFGWNIIKEIHQHALARASDKNEVHQLFSMKNRKEKKEKKEKK